MVPVGSVAAGVPLASPLGKLESSPGKPESAVDFAGVVEPKQPATISPAPRMELAPRNSPIRMKPTSSVPSVPPHATVELTARGALLGFADGLRERGYFWPKILTTVFCTRPSTVSARLALAIQSAYSFWCE